MIGRPPIRSESSPAIGAIRIGIAVQGRIRRPGLERRGALHGLEVLGEQEDRAEHPEEHEQRGDVGRGEGAVAEEAHRQHRRCRRAAPRGRTARGRPRRRASAETTSTDVQPASLPRTRPQTTAEQAGGREGEAGQVEPAVRAVCLLQLPSARAGSARGRRGRSARRSTARRCLARSRRRRAGRARRRGRRCRPRRRARDRGDSAAPRPRGSSA